MTSQLKNDEDKEMFFSRLVLFVGLICLIVGTTLLFIGGPDASSSRLFHSLWDAGHFPFFILVSLFLLSMSRYTLFRLPLRPYPLLLLLVAFLGLGSEIIQSKVGREFSWHDVLSDVTSAIIVIWWDICFARKVKINKSIKIGLTGMTLGLVMLATFPITSALYDDVLAYHQFPLLSGFEAQSEMSRWHCGKAFERQQKQVYVGEWALGFNVQGAGYSGCSLKHFYSNWIGYSRFNFKIWSPRPGILMTLRINDREHGARGAKYNDRFGQHLALRRGWNAFSISLDDIMISPFRRKMDMALIINIGWFVTNLGYNERFYLDDVRLER